MQHVFRYDQWYNGKGSVHIHSTVSDGAKSYEQAIKWYADRGFDFVAVTDHNVIGKEHNRSALIVLSGIEMATHTVELGMSEWRESGVTVMQQQEIDHSNQCGGISILAHPYGHGFSWKHLGALKDYSAIGVYNSPCHAAGRRDQSSVHWDTIDIFTSCPAYSMVTPCRDSVLAENNPDLDGTCAQMPPKTTRNRSPMPFLPCQPHPDREARYRQFLPIKPRLT